jgi:hypothetical protein
MPTGAKATGTDQETTRGRGREVFLCPDRNASNYRDIDIREGWEFEYPENDRWPYYKPVKVKWTNTADGHLILDPPQEVLAGMKQTEREQYRQYLLKRFDMAIAHKRATEKRSPGGC